MGRTKKFPPLPPKDDVEKSVALIPMPPKLTPEALEARKREISLITRDKLDINFDKTVDSIFAMSDTLITEKGVSLEPLRIKLDTLKWLSDRGYGKAPQVVKIGSDEGTPQAILAEIARKRTQEVIDRLEADKMRDEAITTEVEKETGEP